MATGRCPLPSTRLVPAVAATATQAAAIVTGDAGSWFIGIYWIPCSKLLIAVSVHPWIHVKIHEVIYPDSYCHLCSVRVLTCVQMVTHSHPIHIFPHSVHHYSLIHPPLSHSSETIIFYSSTCTSATPPSASLYSPPTTTAVFQRVCVCVWRLTLSYWPVWESVWWFRRW